MTGLQTPDDPRQLDADRVLATLRTFQRRTAEYAFQRLYGAESPTARFLVADEVGLGKTLVARGVLARTVEHLRRIGDPRSDIVYICSNAAIARQNLRKLNIADEHAIVHADRFTLLTKELPKLERSRLNLIAVTPGTGLEFGSSAGTFEERALIYALLQRVWGREKMRGSGPERFFYLWITDDAKARGKLRTKAASMQPSATVTRAFERHIKKLNQTRRDEGRPTLGVEFNRLAEAFRYKGSYSTELREMRNRFIVELRQALATVGIEALQPDLVILDEFQRFRTLLDRSDDSWATRLAHELFDHRDPETGRRTRTLLLSATPYRAYTTASDVEGDTHFDDFIATARFLFDDDRTAAELGDELHRLRKNLLVTDRDGGASAIATCNRIASMLRPVMARTERLASTPDRNGMLRAVTPELSLAPSDIAGYLTASKVAELVDHREVVEYWKSGPYLFNFMENYELKRSFTDATEHVRQPQGLVDIVRSHEGILDWDDVATYGDLDPANARLRALQADTVGRGMWQLLWLPPALPYYDGGGIFDTEQARSFTKRLIFSSWHLVPKVIASMLSFAAERTIFDTAGERSSRAYDGFSERSGRLLDFRLNATREPAGMPVLLFTMPFVELARIADPLSITAATRGDETPNRAAIERVARQAITEALEPLLSGAPDDGQVDQRWYWAAPLLLDFRADPDAAEDWWAGDPSPNVKNGDTFDEIVQSAFYDHVEAALHLIENGGSGNLKRPPEDLVDVLVDVALGSPATCALRSLWRLTGTFGTSSEATLQGASMIGWAFRSLYNSPDATAIVRSTTEREPYWRAALDYGASGNLQAVLDEYLSALEGWQGFLSNTGTDMVKNIADTAAAALRIRTVNYSVDFPELHEGRVTIDQHRMRGRFAIRFGDRSSETGQAQQRIEQASQAFNSPFWPFVMASTSVGQEGLDFHLYSHAVVHWNLPSNPVDFEQREGRVHRYKGHAIRKNVAYACATAAFADPKVDPWAAMFDAAAQLPGSDDELRPYWVFAPDGAPAHIERHVPVLPFSRDASKLDQLLEAVAAYRLTFGQPRQEELLRFLTGRIPPERLDAIVDQLKIDLTPPPTHP